MIVDLPLVRRVEATAARWISRQIDAVTEVFGPEAGRRVDLDGGVLALMGPGRYLNRGVGLGHGGTAPVELLDELEAFYGDAGMPASLEVGPWTPAPLVAELRTRGYTVEWFRNVYAHPLDRVPNEAGDMDIEVVDDDDVEEWMGILGAERDPGTAARVTSDDFCLAMRQVSGSIDLLGRIGGRPVGCGSLTTVQGVAWLGGAATLPTQRGRGVQRALLVRRLRIARRDGCSLAAVTAMAGGSSARNIERVGFRLLYSQAVMTLDRVTR